MKIIVVVVGLVFAPLQVCAECAWVPWGSTIGSKGSTALGGMKTLPDGQREQKTWENRQNATYQAMNQALSKGQTVTPMAPTVFVCLPDTVDPRGPKGR